MRTWAAAVAALAVLLDLAASVLAGIGGDAAGAVAALPYTAFPVVGFVIVRAQPRNAVGQVFLAAGVLLAINNAGGAGATTGAVLRFPGPLRHAFEVADGASWLPGLFLVITVGLLHFPDGRPVSPWWRWVDVAALSAMAAFVVGIPVAAWDLPDGVLVSAVQPPADILLITFICLAVILPCVLGAVVSLVVRWRRSRGTARLQIRWVAAAGLVATVVEVVDDGLGTLGSPLPDAVQTLTESVGFSLVAVATGIAITRYRLYDIDRIISRTVGYAVLTALLVGTYVGVVALAGTVIPRRYGSVGVAAATLAVAALFVPIRRRIQRAVDRRFDRTRYDADRTVDAFAATLRTDLSPTDLHAALLATVARAVAPAAAGLWLPPPAVPGAGRSAGVEVAQVLQDDRAQVRGP